MRFKSHLLIFAVFFVALIGSWNHRYERVPGSKIYTLSDLKPVASSEKGIHWEIRDSKMVLRLKKTNTDPSVVYYLPIPLTSGYSALHIAYQIKAIDLISGQETWNDGRFNLAWVSSNLQQLQQVDSVRDNRARSTVSLVSIMPELGYEPKLMFAQLGVSGELEVSELEVALLRERSWWRVGFFAIFGALFVWLVMVLSWTAEVSRWRIMLSASIILCVFWQTVIPGPWILMKPLVLSKFVWNTNHESLHSLDRTMENKDFVITAPVIEELKDAEILQPPIEAPIISESPIVQHDPPNPERMLTSKPMVIQTNLFESIRNYLKPFKELHHVAFFGFLTFIFVCLIGKRSAIYASAFISVASEWAQFAFGYGFGWGDIGDMAMDGIGTIIGLAVMTQLLLLLSRLRQACSASNCY